jgi:plastocyanin
MRKLVVPATALAVSGVLAATALGANKTVNVGDNYFLKSSPNNPTLRIKRNDRVTFKWVGRAPHNVKTRSGPARFESPVKTSGTYRRTFTRRGTYRLFCEVHGASDQSMTIRVR